MACKCPCPDHPTQAECPCYCWTCGVHGPAATPPAAVCARCGLPLFPPPAVPWTPRAVQIVRGPNGDEHEICPVTRPESPTQGGK